VPYCHYTPTDCFFGDFAHWEDSRKQNEANFFNTDVETFFAGEENLGQQKSGLKKI